MEIFSTMKNSYILLRNNKESTSLSIEQLQEIGLKKTDLIWVECQSMNWRSPFEIAELKNLVSAGSNEDKKNSAEKLISQEVPNHEGLLKKREAGKAWTDPFIKNLEKYSHPEQVILSGLEKKEIDLPANKSSSPGEIKGMYAENPGQREHRKKSVFASQIPERVKKMPLYIGLVLSGALLTLLIKNWENKRPVAEQQTNTLPGRTTDSTATLPKTLDDTSAIRAANITEPDLLIEKSSVNALKQKGSVSGTINLLQKTDATTAAGDSSNNNGEKNTTAVMEIKAKPVTVEDISSKIAIEANDYDVGAFGGIRNLKITLQNGSTYVLDKVTVELKYLNPDGNIIKTEQLYFQNVRPQDAASLEVDKSKRGIKVEYQVTNIECKALTTSQPGLADPNYSTN
jgi:hypothetical protein